MAKPSQDPFAEFHPPASKRRGPKLTHLEYYGKKFPILSETASNACPSFSLEAGPTCPGPVLDAKTGLPTKHTPCHYCYAYTGQYLRPSVHRAQVARTAWTRDAVKRERFHTTLVRAIQDRGCEYLRLHDSGDFYDAPYVLAWLRVCLQLPQVKFWAPTRSWRLEALLPALRALAALPNVCVRPSALFVDEPPTRVMNLDKGHVTIRYYPEGHEDPSRYWECPQKKDGDTCQTLGCRKCWEKDYGQVISFLGHDMTGKERSLTEVPKGVRTGRKQRVCDFQRDVAAWKAQHRSRTPPCNIYWPV